MAVDWHHINRYNSDIYGWNTLVNEILRRTWIILSRTGKKFIHVGAIRPKSRPFWRQRRLAVDMTHRRELRLSSTENLLTSSKRVWSLLLTIECWQLLPLQSEFKLFKWRHRGSSNHRRLKTHPYCVSLLYPFLCQTYSLFDMCIIQRINNNSAFELLRSSRSENKLRTFRGWRLDSVQTDPRSLQTVASIRRRWLDFIVLTHCSLLVQRDDTGTGKIA